jgi:hypothetical protein
MSSEKTKWHNGVWIVAIATVILSPIVTDLYNRAPILTSFKWLWFSLLSFTNIPIPLWAVLGTFFWYSIIYWLYHRKGRKKAINEPILKEEKPIPKQIVHTAQKIYAPVALEIYDEQKSKTEKMLKYKAGKFFGNVWIWKWKFNKLINEYEIKNILPVCDKENCDQEPMSFVSGDSIGYLYYCNKCQKSRYFKETTIQIEKEIEKNLKTI